MADQLRTIMVSYWTTRGVFLLKSHTHTHTLLCVPSWIGDLATVKIKENARHHLTDETWLWLAPLSMCRKTWCSWAIAEFKKSCLGSKRRCCLTEVFCPICCSSHEDASSPRQNPAEQNHVIVIGRPPLVEEVWFSVSKYFYLTLKFRRANNAISHPHLSCRTIWTIVNMSEGGVTWCTWTRHWAVSPRS